MKNSDVKEKKKTSDKKEKKSNIILVTTLVVLLLCTFVAFGYGICGVNIRDKMVKNKSNNNTTKNVEKVKEKEDKEEWKSLGTDISKIKDVYDSLSNYTYNSSRTRGGKSFYEFELFGIVSNHISKEDITVTQRSGEEVFFGTVPEEKIFSIIKKYVGDNYNIENTLNYDYDSLCMSDPLQYLNNRIYAGLNVVGYGKMFSIICYDKASHNFMVEYYGYDSTSGPEAKIIDRKVVGVSEKDDIIKVEEKAIYTEYNSFNDEIIYKIYGTPNHSYYIAEKRFNVDIVSSQVISVDDYINSASTITSYFKRNSDGSYYLLSSDILDKTV